MGDEADAWQSRDRCLLECTVPAFGQAHGAGFRAMPSYLDLAVHKKLISHKASCSSTGQNFSCNTSTLQPSQNTEQNNFEN
eukprot:scaffold72983_cov43-Cyclotella_meneghiniana.AAC.1